MRGCLKYGSELTLVSSNIVGSILQSLSTCEKVKRHVIGSRDGFTGSAGPLAQGKWGCVGHKFCY